jgi:hypothetical protein
MSHWAELDEKNIVIRVTVGDNNDPNGDEGYQWLVDNLGGKWVKTSYNSNIRKNFAGIGYTYNESLDAFIPPKPNPNPSFILDIETCRWKPPIEKPEGNYYWDEQSIQWLEVDLESINTNNI